LDDLWFFSIRNSSLWISSVVFYQQQRSLSPKNIIDLGGGRVTFEKRRTNSDRDDGEDVLQ
ncbi:unnamed protein product, partial [Musa banksii]